MDDVLRSLGLSEEERNVYLACLRLGTAKASTIAQKAKVQRQASYYTLKLLMEKGFVSKSVKSGVTHYQATHPKLLMQKIADETEDKTRACQELLTQWEVLKGAALPKTQIELYEGPEGFKTMLRDGLSTPNEPISCWTTAKVVHYLPTFALQFRRIRKERNMFLRVISEIEGESEQSRKEGNQRLLEMRFDDKLLRGKNYGVFIVKDKVFFVQVTEKDHVGFKVQDKSFADFQRALFNRMWKIARR